MSSAAVSFLVGVVGAYRIRIINKLSFQEGFYLSVRVSGSPGIQFNSCFSQGVSCAAADSAADQHIYAAAHKKSCKGAVSLPVGVYNFITLYG